MSNKMTKETKSWIKAILIVAGIGGLLFAGTAMASPAQTVTQISQNVRTSVGVIARMLVTISVMAGIGFIMASFFKFHQHKQNPTQVPLSQGITLVLIGAAMIVFPYLLNPITSAVFGQGSVAKISGGAIQQFIGQ